MNNKLKSTSHRFGVNVFSNLFLFTLIRLIGFWFTPYLIRNLGIALYGLVPLANSFTSYLSLITLSFNGAVGRYLAIDIQKNNSQEANATFNTALFGILAITVLALPILIWSITFVPLIFNIPLGSETATKYFFLLVTLSFFVSAIDTCFAVSSWVKSRFDLRNIVLIASNTVRFLTVIVIFSFIKPNVIYVGVGIFFASIVGLAGNYILWRKLTPDLNISLRKISPTHIRELFSMGSWLVVNQIGYILFFDLDLMVVNIVLGAVLAGEYGSVLLFSSVLFGLAVTVSEILTPIFVGKFAANDFQHITKVSSQAIRLMGILLALPVGFICGFGGPFLQLWLGKEFGNLWLLLVLLMFHLPSTMSVLPLNGIKTALNKLRIPGIVAILMGIGKLLFGLFFTLVLRWGMYGIAGSSAIFFFFKNVIFTPLYCARIQKIPWTTYLLPILPGTIVTIITGLAAWATTRLVIIDSWVALISVGTLLGILALPFIYFFALKEEDRSFLISFIKTYKNTRIDL